MNYFLELVGGQCMNDYRGLLIKKQRKELDISLEALSHGVCSPSYLSKIENNILVANDDIYNLLFKKLGISTMDTIKEEKIKQMLDLFFKYYMSSDSKIFKVMDELLEYKDEVVSSCLFVQYQLFLLYASEMNSQINISLAEVEAYYSYMDDSQREYFNFFRLSSGNMELSDNEEWIFIRRLKAKANLYAYQKNTFAAYDLYKTCLNYAIELGNKKLIAEILCSLGWLCLDIDLNQAEKYYTSAAQYDSQYKMLAFFNLGATMIQHKDCMEKGNQYLKKGLKSCTDDFFAVNFAVKYKEALFVYAILKENIHDAKRLIKELDDSKYIDVFSMMLNEDYQLNVDYRNRLKELKNDSSLFKFLFIKNCEYLHKYKEICVANNFI